MIHNVSSFSSTEILTCEIENAGTRHPTPRLLALNYTKVLMSSLYDARRKAFRIYKTSSTA